MPTDQSILTANRLLSSKEVMAFFGHTDRSSFHQFCRRNGIPLIQLGVRRTVFEPSAIRAYLNAKSIGHVPNANDQGGAAA